MSASRTWAVAAVQNTVDVQGESRFLAAVTLHHDAFIAAVQESVTFIGEGEALSGAVYAQDAATFRETFGSFPGR
jgi:hypothetical protein